MPPAPETPKEMADRLRHSQALQHESTAAHIVKEGVVFAGISALVDIALVGVRSVSHLAMRALPMAAIGAIFGLSSAIDRNHKIDEVRREIDKLSPPER